MNKQYEFEREFNKVLADEKILKSNRETIRNYIIEENARGKSKNTLISKLWAVSSVARMLNKPFQECSKEDLVELVNYIENNYKSYGTKKELKAKTKMFWKWLKKTDEFPNEVKWLKTNGHPKTMPRELLTAEEVESLANASDNPRNKALILCIYESGCRIGEMLSLRLKNIMFDEYGFVLLVDGKTGQRRVRIVKYADSLKEWLDIHPHKDNTDSFLWCGLYKNGIEVIDYKSVCHHLKRLKLRLGIKKKCNPHSLRHARATELSKHLTEAQMKAYFGWTQDSGMASVYVHLSGKDIDGDLMKSYGMDAKEKVELKPVDNLFTKSVPDDLIYKFLMAIAEENPHIKQKFRDIVAQNGFGEVFR